MRIYGVILITVLYNCYPTFKKLFMPKILITGNGFDLSVGLPTSYNDFMKTLLLVESGDLSFDSVYSNSSNYKELIKNFDKISFDLDKIELIKQNIEHNVWYKFFKNEFEIETWIDFEGKIEVVINILFSALDYIEKIIFSKGSFFEVNNLFSTALFNNDLRMISVLNSFGVINLSSDNNISINEKFLIKEKDYYNELRINEMSKYLYSELTIFKKILSLYFQTFIYPFYEKIKSNFDISFLSNINKHFTFNYTATFEKVYRKNKITRFLHGRIDSVPNNIVLGINEILNDSNEKRDFLPFTKYFQKLYYNTDYAFLKEFEGKSPDFMFFIYGHSLDRSDSDYVNEIFEFIKNSKSKIKKIIVIYHNEESRFQLLHNILDIRGKNEITELMKTKVLVFNLIGSTDLKNNLNKGISENNKIRSTKN